jgi:hypothetical protein
VKVPDQNEQHQAGILDLDAVESGSATPMNGAAKKTLALIRVAPPNDTDAEGVVLAALLVSPDESFPKVLDIVRPHDFYSLSNRRIAEVVWALRDEGLAIDAVAVATRLRELEQLEPIGGSPYLARLLDETPAAAHVDDHARTVRDCAKARRIADGALRIAADAKTGTNVDALARRLQELAVDADITPPKPALEAHWVRLVDRPEFLTEQPPAQTWLLKQWTDSKDRGVLPRGQIGLLSADGGTGKGFALSQLAMAVSTGGFWLETFRVVERGHVLLGLGEEDFDEARRRLWRVANALELSVAERTDALQRIDLLAVHGVSVALTGAGSDGAIFETAVADDLRKQLEGRGVDWSAIILDPLSRWAGGGVEVDNEAATRFAQVVESLTYVRGRPSGLVSHHSSKFSARAGESDSRGVSGLRNAFRWEATLDAVRADDGTRGAILRNKKNNLAPQFDDLVLVRREDSGVEGVLRLASEAEAEALGSKKSGKAAVQNDDLDARILDTIRRHRVKSANNVADLTQGTKAKILARVKALRFADVIGTDANGFLVVREAQK